MNDLINLLHVYCVISLSSCCLLLYHAPLCLCGYISQDCTVLWAAVLMRFLSCHCSEGSSLLVQLSALHWRSRQDPELAVAPKNKTATEDYVTEGTPTDECCRTRERGAHHDSPTGSSTRLVFWRSGVL